MVFGNEFQRIKMKKCHFEALQRNKATVGVPYTYYQRDSVEGEGNGVQEYCIVFPALCRLLWIC